jgi:hypothetical protein
MDSRDAVPKPPRMDSRRLNKKIIAMTNFQAKPLIIDVRE